MRPAVSRPESGSLSPDPGKPEDCHGEQPQTPVRPMCPHTPCPHRSLHASTTVSILSLFLSLPTPQTPLFLEGHLPNVTKSLHILPWARLSVQS